MIDRTLVGQAGDWVLRSSCVCRYSSNNGSGVVIVVKSCYSIGGAEVGIVEGREVVYLELHPVAHPSLDWDATSEGNVDGGRRLRAGSVNAVDGLEKFAGGVAGADDGRTRNAVEVMLTHSGAAGLGHHQNDVGFVLLEPFYVFATLVRGLTASYYGSVRKRLNERI